MPLPDLLLPPGVPNFVVAAQSFGQLRRYGNVERGQGHDRKRRLRTRTPRVIDVASKKLSQAQMTALEDWYEDALLAGERPFSVELSNQGPGTLWWSARWVKSSFKQEPSNGGWVVSGQLHLTGQGEVDPPVLGALAFEYSLVLTGQALMLPDASLAFEYLLQLKPDAPMAFEYYLRLESAVHNLQREDGSDYQREDGAPIQRET